MNLTADTPSSSERKRQARLACVRTLALLILLSFLAPFGLPAADDPPIKVRHLEGLLHGFLVLKNPQGEILADGQLQQTTLSTNRIQAELVFHFKDGSLFQETTVFTQRRYFHLISDHLIQKGPSFKKPLDMTVDGNSGRVAVSYEDDHGEQKTETKDMRLPANLGNGLVTMLVGNMEPRSTGMTVSMVVATPKPRLIRLDITPEEEDTFAVGGGSCKVRHFVAKVNIGGVAGAVADVLGKQPPDTHFWIVQGGAPLFVKSEGPLADEGPIWQIELVAPTGPKGKSEK